MRIGLPARKHGVADDDIRHAVRNAMRRVAMANDLVMLIGPATDGSLLGSESSTSTATTQSLFTP
jgi:hypothetical protein